VGKMLQESAISERRASVLVGVSFRPQWSQFVFGVKEPLDFRRNGAGVFSA
jgi:hypothetical protein